MTTDTPIEPGSTWSYKGKSYVIAELGKLRVKDSDDGNWHDAVAYADVKADVEDEAPTFVRKRDDFLAKFKPDECEA